MKLRLIFMVLVATVSLSGCMTITKQIQNTVANSTHYPAALGITEVSTSPPLVNVTRYKPYRTDPQSKQLAIALAVSGGGYRASNLVIGVLLGLEQYKDPRLQGNLLQNIDYISSVSGGGFGIGYYLSRLYGFEHKHATDYPQPVFSLKKQLSESLQYPAQKINGHYTGKGNVLNLDLSSMIDLGANHYDEYEQALNEALLGGTKNDFVLGDVFVPKYSNRKAYLPLWVVNATIYQNMGIFRFAPGVIAAYKLRGYRHMGKDQAIYRPYTDPNYASQLPFSVALAASSSVPFAMSATTLESESCSNQCYLQLFDGGLSDNLGLDSAYEMLSQNKAKQKLLIIVDASGSVPHAFSKEKESPGIFSMIWQVMNSGIDANHIIEKNDASKVVHAILCQEGAKNVLVAYLDLSEFPKAYDIPTSLSLTSAQQKQLFTIGQKIVSNSKTLQVSLRELLAGNQKVDACSPAVMKKIENAQRLTPHKLRNQPMKLKKPQISEGSGALAK